jgi:glycogen debranching enzyme
MTLRLCLLSSVVCVAFAADLKPLPNFSVVNHELEIVSPCVPSRPWTVAGEHGALLGRQNGKFEAWQWPVKILSDFRVRAELADYAVPIDVNALAASIRVTPAETVVTYSHSAFTVRQHMFAGRGPHASLPAAVFFEIDSIRPLVLTFSFTPEMLRMWPAANFGRPNGEWVKQGESGYYVLHTDNEQFSAAVIMPRTRAGIMVPYQEHPQTYPLEFKLDFDPKTDRGLVFPLVVTLSRNGVADVVASLPKAYADTQNYYAHFFDHRLVAETPDPRINEGLRWAEIAIDQAQVQTPEGETGMVAGYYESADSARPGYAWFFGRDTLWSTYAINSYGDYSLTKRALDFLIRRQRVDGKIMHEYSQAAESIDWKSTPYFYASADSTPLLLMAAADYARKSGDQSYIKTNWAVLKKAYVFMRAHEGNNGIYSNAEGTGWVESWPSGMPQEETYLAALDAQAYLALSELAKQQGEAVLAREADAKAREASSEIEKHFYDKQDSFYAFSRNNDGTLDRTASIYPAVAWWDGNTPLTEATPMLSRWASHEFSTDWGTRDISEKTSFYDPISYHQGSVWPLFTGWVSLAEYRAGRPLAGYASLMQNLNLTWAQDLGSVTELLSGQYFQPLGRSSSHQLWSSAMIVSPLVRGLFGISWDAVRKQLTVNPQLPADWEYAKLRHVQVGDIDITLEMNRVGSELRVQAITESAEVLCLSTHSLPPKSCATSAAKIHTLTIPLPPVELAIPAQLPEPGESTRQLKALAEQWSEHSATFSFEAQGSALYHLPARFHRANIKVDGARINGNTLDLQFPAGEGYITKTVAFQW